MANVCGKMGTEKFRESLHLFLCLSHLPLEPLPEATIWCLLLLFTLLQGVPLCHPAVGK